MNFTIRWPEDATRIAPVPAKHPCCFMASKPFVLGVAGNQLASVEAPGAHSVTHAFAEPDEIAETLVTWNFADGLIGQSWILPLPNTADVKARTLAHGPWSGKHGVLANRRSAAVQARASWGMLHSKYDALLSANLDPAGPADRRVVVPMIGMTLELAHDRIAITGDAVAAFEQTGRSLHWWFSLHGIRFSVDLALGEGNAIRLRWQMLSPVANDVKLHVSPTIDDRSFHNVTKAFQGPETALPQAISASANGFSFKLHDGHEVVIASTVPFQSNPHWRYCVPLPEETSRGLEDMTDVFSPGEFIWSIANHQHCELTVSVDGAAPPLATTPTSISDLPLPQAMARSLDLHLSHRGNELTVIAGYGWFLDWGRDSLIFTRGLIAVGRADEAGSIIRRFASFEQDGTLPNLLRGSEITNRETSDAPLWLIVAAGEWVRANGNSSADCNGRTLLQIMRSIIDIRTGTMDSASGLLYSAPHHTWMDTDHPPCTPREGYPIEIQALWCRALRVVAGLANDSHLAELAIKVAHSIETLFWREDEGYFADCLHACAGVPAAEAVADDHLRPNQWLAITLDAITDQTKSQRALLNSQCLLVPGAARSLAPRPVKHALPVVANGQSLNDPTHPYWPRYTGPEDLTRKPAYHNGTAWCWQYPLFPEALVKAYGTSHLDAARRLMSASLLPWQDGCAGQLPEIMDGDMPHLQRGCGAQAWSISEWLRVWHFLETA